MSARAVHVMRVMARKAARRSSYMGWVLAEYQRAERVSDTELMALLDADDDSMRRLAICLRPRENAFAADVLVIAGKLGLDPSRLAGMIRHADTLAAMQASAGSVGGQGQLLAARFKAGSATPISDPATLLGNTDSLPGNRNDPRGRDRNLDDDDAGNEGA